MAVSSHLNWPEHLDRTDPDQRENTRKYDSNFRKTRTDLRREMENGVGADEWWLDHISGSGGDPGVVVRWTKGGREHAAACDRYTTKRDNLRTLYLWIKETRKSGDRPVKTGHDQFAAAALPGEVDPNAAPVGPPPHEVLGVAEDADPDVVAAVAKRLKRKHHPDSGEEPDEDRFKRVVEAEEAMVG